MAELGSVLIGVISSILAALLLKYMIDLVNKRMSFNRIMREIEHLNDLIVKDGYSPDLIVAIDRNSSVVGSILSGFFGLKTIISIATVNTREADGSRRIEISTEHLPNTDLMVNKKILLLICCNDSGTSLGTVFEYFSSLPTPPKEIRTAALFTTVSPQFRPRYYSVEVGEDVKLPMNKIISRMPWMKRGWKHVFGQERKAR